MLIIYRGLGFVVLLFVTLAVIAGNAIQLHLHFNDHVLNVVIVVLFALFCILFDEMDRYDSTLFFMAVRTWGYLAVLVPMGLYAWHVYQHRLDLNGIKAEFAEFIQPPSVITKALAAAATATTSAPPAEMVSPPPSVAQSNDTPAAVSVPPEPAAPAAAPTPSMTGMQDKFRAVFPNSQASIAITAAPPLQDATIGVPFVPSAGPVAPPAAKDPDPAPELPVTARKPTNFNCGRRSLGVDYVICTSDQLLDLEAILEDAYATARANLNEYSSDQLRANERLWSNRFGIECGLPDKGEPPADVERSAQDCVATSMRSRIIYLKGFSHPLAPVEPTPVPSIPAADEHPSAASDSDDDSSTLNLICRGSQADNSDNIVDQVTINEKAKSATIDLSYIGLVLKFVDGANAGIINGSYDIPGHPEAAYGQNVMRKIIGDDKVSQFFRTEANSFVFGAGGLQMTIDRGSGRFTGFPPGALTCEVTDTPTKRRF